MWRVSSMDDLLYHTVFKRALAELNYLVHLYPDDKKLYQSRSELLSAWPESAKKSPAPDYLFECQYNNEPCGVLDVYNTPCGLPKGHGSRHAGTNNEAPERSEGANYSSIEAELGRYHDLSNAPNKLSRPVFTFGEGPGLTGDNKPYSSEEVKVSLSEIGEGDPGDEQEVKAGPEPEWFKPFTPETMHDMIYGKYPIIKKPTAADIRAAREYMKENQKPVDEDGNVTFLVEEGEDEQRRAKTSPPWDFRGTWTLENGEVAVITEHYNGFWDGYLPRHGEDFRECWNPDGEHDDPAFNLKDRHREGARRIG